MEIKELKNFRALLQTTNAKYTSDDQDDKEHKIIIHMNRKSFRKGKSFSVSSFTDFA